MGFFYVRGGGGGGGGDPTIHSIFLSGVTTNEINKIIQSLKNGAAGHDDITAANLKIVARSINQPLAYLCNLSFTQGVFPKELKLANVLPSYKSEDPLVSTIIVLCPYCVFCQRFLKNWCMIDFWIFWRFIIFFFCWSIWIQKTAFFIHGFNDPYR